MMVLQSLSKMISWAYSNCAMTQKGTFPKMNYLIQCQSLKHRFNAVLFMLSRRWLQNWGSVTLQLSSGSNFPEVPFERMVKL